MAVSKRLRYEVLRRDNHACRYCGAMAPDVRLTIDHVVPVALGGHDDADNLVTACIDCNSGKSATTPDAALVDDVKQDALRWTRAMQIAQQVQMAQREWLLDYTAMVEDAWQGWRSDDEPLPLPTDWRTTIETFYRYNVTLSDWRYAVRTAMTDPRLDNENRWRFTCGVLWRIIRERTELAGQVLAEDGDLDGTD